MSETQDLARWSICEWDEDDPSALRLRLDARDELIVAPAVLVGAFSQCIHRNEKSLQPTDRIYLESLISEWREAVGQIESKIAAAQIRAVETDE